MLLCDTTYLESNLQPLALYCRILGLWLDHKHKPKAIDRFYTKDVIELTNTLLNFNYPLHLLFPLSFRVTSYRAVILVRVEIFLDFVQVRSYSRKNYTWLRHTLVPNNETRLIHDLKGEFSFLPFFYHVIMK